MFGFGLRFDLVLFFDFCGFLALLFGFDLSSRLFLFVEVVVCVCLVCFDLLTEALSFHEFAVTPWLFGAACDKKDGMDV